MTERERFEKWFKDYLSGDGFEDEIDKSIAKDPLGDYKITSTLIAFDAYQAATKAALPEWIPVSERMPEYGVAVFVVIDGIFKLIPFKRVCFGGVWWWESVISSTCMLYDISDVTHWMPLPSAPEQNK
jgi:hypothetical protein